LRGQPPTDPSERVGDLLEAAPAEIELLDVGEKGHDLRKALEAMEA